MLSSAPLALETSTVMYPLLILIGLVTSFWSAFQLQVVSFAPRMSLVTIHKFETKRWFLRGIAGVCVLLLNGYQGYETGAAIVVILISLLLGLSFVIDNTKGFRDLNEKEIIKSRRAPLDRDTMVVGVALPGERSVCYPIEDMVLPRHLLNDLVGSAPLLVSYCAACRSCIVYHPVVEGMRLRFQVVAVWRRNMVMRDRETGTLWQQATGEAIYGELKGKTLEMLMSQQMRLKYWKEAYPDSLIATESERAPTGRIPKPMLKRMLRITEHTMARGLTDVGDALPLREKVFGVTLNGVSKAYPISRLKGSPDVLDSVGDTPVRIVYEADTNHISGINLEDRSPLILESHWWFGWKEFHPYTEVWTGDGIEGKH